MKILSCCSTTGSTRSPRTRTSSTLTRGWFRSRRMEMPSSCITLVRSLHVISFHWKEVKLIDHLLNLLQDTVRNFVMTRATSMTDTTRHSAHVTFSLRAWSATMSCTKFSWRVSHKAHIWSAWWIAAIPVCQIIVLEAKDIAPELISRTNLILIHVNFSLSRIDHGPPLCIQGRW